MTYILPLLGILGWVFVITSISWLICTRNIRGANCHKSKYQLTEREAAAFRKLARRVVQSPCGIKVLSGLVLTYINELPNSGQDRCVVIGRGKNLLTAIESIEEEHS